MLNFFSMPKLLKHASFLFFIGGICFSGSLQAVDEAPCYVTYDFSGGRFGDNLLAYLRAKWISYKYKIPLLYKPFPYSLELCMHDKETLFVPKLFKEFQSLSFFDVTEDQLIFAENGPQSIIVCPYFPEGTWERENLRGPYGEVWRCFDVDWKDVDFRRSLKDFIKPNYPCNVVTPPKGVISIAMHFRQGGTYDPLHTTLGFITKFPPIEFYIEGLLNMIILFPDKPLYCYLFTDADDPAKYVEMIRTRVPATTPITFDWRQTNNSHDLNVLEDFFSLFNFDVLIHSQSNFGVIPSLIHDFAVTFSAVSGHLERDHIKIDQVDLKVNDEIYRRIAQ